MRPAQALPPVPGGEPRLLENLATGVLLFDAKLHLRALNPAAEALLEVSANQVVGWPAARLFGAEGTPTLALAEALATGRASSERDLQVQLLAARAVSVDCTVTPLGPEGSAEEVLMELTGLDNHKRIAREELLLSQNETARTMVRGLAHEIRNPLGGLRGAAQLLEKALNDEGLREYTQVIIREADRLQGLVDRLLGPRALPHKQSISVHEVTERVRLLIEAEAPPSVSVIRDYDPSLPPISADPSLLIQAVLNVARNAVQALGSGPGRVTLRTRIERQCPVGARHRRLVVRIDVCDNGPGIPDRLRDMLFYPMVTGRPEGAGLGLSIAQSIVHQHGGIIELLEGRGDTTFSILLPVDETL